METYSRKTRKQYPNQNFRTEKYTIWYLNITVLAQEQNVDDKVKKQNLGDKFIESFLSEEQEEKIYLKINRALEELEIISKVLTQKSWDF